MDASTSPAAARHVTKVPHEQHDVQLIRCTSADLHLLTDYCDGVLGRDYFFKRRHLLSILERPTNAVFAVCIDGRMGGMCIVYKSTVLDNLYLSPEFRTGGIGSAILAIIRPTRIRSKTNMLAGDPTAFYERNGYVKDIADPRRPHIIDMVQEQGAVPGAQLQGVPAPVTQPPWVQVTADGADRIKSTADKRAVGVELSGSVTATSRSSVATPAPLVTHGIAAASAAVLSNGQVVMDADEYNDLVKLRRGRDRVRAYRERRKADTQRQPDAAAAAVIAPVQPTLHQLTSDAPMMNGEFDFNTFRD